MKCPDDQNLISEKEMSENVLEEIALNTKVVPWNQGYKGKITARVEAGTDKFTSWCLLEEIKEQYDRITGE